MKKALVLGAGGFIGSHIVKRFKRSLFCVATKEDNTRWQKAIVPLEGYCDLYIKYISEFQLAMSYLH